MNNNNNPFLPWPQDLGELPHWISRVAGWMGNEIEASVGPDWQIRALHGLLIVLIFVAASLTFIVWQKHNYAG